MWNVKIYFSFNFKQSYFPLQGVLNLFPVSKKYMTADFISGK